MRNVARVLVVAAVALAPLAGAAPASACTDDGGACLVNCVQDLVTKGSCRL